jgi:putative transposase
MSREDRKAMILRNHPDLSLSRQCRLLTISRSSLYYAPKGESPENLTLMRRIDELFLKYPFYGSRQMARHLWREGIEAGRHRVRRLMRLMGLEAIYQAPRTSMPHPAHRIFPYLLTGMVIDRPNQVWCADITYIPVQRGFLYLVAIMDWATRHVLAWRLSNTMDAQFCVEALNEALTRYGRPEIFNTDQGSQFTSFNFTDALKDAGIRISMDGRGRCMDNIFIERLWRSGGIQDTAVSAYESGLLCSSSTLATSGDRWMGAAHCIKSGHGCGRDAIDLAVDLPRPCASCMLPTLLRH